MSKFFLFSSYRIAIKQRLRRTCLAENKYVAILYVNQIFYINLQQP